MNLFINKIQKLDYSSANTIIESICGIVNYFSNDIEKEAFVVSRQSVMSLLNEDRISYGDWQTPAALSKAICIDHLNRFGNPDIILEPTCGLGSFILSALDVFNDVSEIHAIEINREHVAELKWRILCKFLSGTVKKHPRIFIYNEDIFSFKFDNIRDKIISNNWKLSIIGNPPWVTNSRQGKDNSANVPVKSNFHNLRGIDAITGKSNFDISEYITLQLLSIFSNCRGEISLLLKNSVIRNIISRQKEKPLPIGELIQNSIDAAKEFNVAVEASCFSAKFASIPSFICNVFDFYNNIFQVKYGWINNSFVSNIEKYVSSSIFDGLSEFEWRSGVKHDCSQVLELTKDDDGQFINGLGESVNIEDEFIYPLIKSSDVSKAASNGFRKYVVLPQKRVGENTSALKSSYPRLYCYLSSHKEYFSRRKSSIYRGKDLFSIFGIGDYSFLPYKVVVSSFYKKIEFSLISPYNGKPVIIDDTCYQLGFDNYESAKLVLDTLKSREIRNLIDSLIFPDSKRVVTKSLLMRIDIMKYLASKHLSSKLKCRTKSSYMTQRSLFDL